jgi:hypothetical protein
MPAGRPSKRTDELTGKIAEWISFGLSNKEVCALAHISEETFYQWSKDEEFAQAIEAAVATRTLERIKIVEAGGKNWIGSAWILERMFPHRFGKPEVQRYFQLKQEGEPAVKNVTDQEQVLKDLHLLGYGKQQQ